MRPRLCCNGGPASLGPTDPGGPATCPAGTKPLLPKAAPDGAPVIKPGRPHVVAEEGVVADPDTLPAARLDSLPVSKRGAEDELMGGEALVPGCAGMPGEASAGDRATASELWGQLGYPYSDDTQPTRGYPCLRCTGISELRRLGVCCSGPVGEKGGVSDGQVV